MKIFNWFKSNNKPKAQPQTLEEVADSVSSYLKSLGVAVRSKEEALVIARQLTGVEIPDDETSPELTPLINAYRGIAANPTYNKAVIENTEYVNRDGLYKYKRPYHQKLYDDIDALVLGDRFFGKAHESAIKLANTDFVMLLPDTIDKEKQREIIEFVHEKQYEWFLGGFHTLQSTLHSQIITAGAVAVEAAPNRSLDRVIIKAVEPKTINLYYDPETEGIRYFQDLGGTLKYAMTNGRHEIELNPRFFRYIPSTPLRGNLYGIPTFAKAMDSVHRVASIAQQADKVIERYSILGVITAMVKPPMRLPRETEEAHVARVETFLKGLLPNIIEGYKQGILVGVHNQTEYNATNVVGDISSFKDLYREFKDEHISALGSYSMFFNKLDNVSDAVVRALKEEYSANIDDNTKIVIQAMEFILNMALKYSPYSTQGYVRLMPKASVITDKLRREQATAVELTNAQLKYTQGFLSQTQAAQSVGIDTPYEDAPLVPEESQSATNENGNVDRLRRGNRTGVNVPNANSPAGSAATRRDTNPSSTRVTSPNRNALNYDDIFVLSEACDTDGTFVEELARTKELSLLERRTDEYLMQLNNKYDIFLGKVQSDAQKAARSLAEEDDITFIKSTLMQAVYDSFERNFDINDIVDDIIPSLYREFASDESILKLEEYKQTYRDNKELNTDDIKFISYFKAFDKFYLSKILYDSAFIDQVDNIFESATGEVSLSKKLLLDALLENVKGALEVQKWKLGRVAATTLNRLRNIAALSMLNKANVQRYRIVEAMDGRTCGYCKNMHGKEFEVSLGVSNMKAETSRFSLNTLTPFLTSLFKKPEQMPQTSASLASAGILKPPFHPYCRGVIVPI